MRTPGELISYFEQLATDHVWINDFVHGDFDEILAEERSNIQYPALWMETPEIPMDGDSDSYTQQYEGSFVIYHAAPPDHQERRKSNLERCFLIARDVILRLMNDQENDLYDFSIDSIRMEPVISYNNDNAQGWRVNYILKHQGFECYDADRWTSVFPAGTFARFTFEEDRTNMVFDANCDTPTSGFTYNWIYYIDDMETQYTDDGKQLVVVGAWDRLYVELRLEYNGSYKVASTYLTSKKSGTSVPFAYNPLNV